MQLPRMIRIAAVVIAGFHGTAHGSTQDQPAAASYQRLADMSGQWSCLIRVWREPQQPQQKTYDWPMRVTREMILDGRVLVESAEVPTRRTPAGMHWKARRFLGFDESRQTYWTTVIENTSNVPEVSSGSLNASAQLEFHGRFNDPSSGMTPTRTVYSMPAAGKQVIESYQVLAGKEYRFMETTCTKAR